MLTVVQYVLSSYAASTISDVPHFVAAKACANVLWYWLRVHAGAVRLQGDYVGDNSMSGLNFRADHTWSSARIPWNAWSITGCVLAMQFLDSYKSVTLESMASAFDVSSAFLDSELVDFICAGRLHAKIDKVAGVIETNRWVHTTISFLHWVLL